MNKLFLKRIYIKFYVILIILFFSLFSFQASSVDELSTVYGLKISGSSKSVFNVELAYTHEEMKTGLMYRKHLDDNSGMLFFFGKEKIVRMWMKNTYIPLDMVFIDKNGKISSFVTNTTPHSLKVVSSVLPVKYVLELNAGAVKNNDIRKGDMVNIKEIIEMHKSDLKVAADLKETK